MIVENGLSGAGVYGKAVGAGEGGFDGKVVVTGGLGNGSLDNVVGDSVNVSAQFGAIGGGVDLDSEGNVTGVSYSVGAGMGVSTSATIGGYVIRLW